MKCDKCNHENSIYNIICEKCGAPLKIEENFILQEKYRIKGKPIEIEDLEKTQKMPDFNNTRKKVSKVVIFIIIALIVSLFYYLYCFLVDNNSKKLITEYNNLMKNSSLTLFYFGNNEKLNEIANTFSTNYDYNYLNIRTNDISSRKKNSIRKELNIYNVSSTFVIVRNGVPIVNSTNIKSGDELISFLQDNQLIPQVLEDTTVVLESFKGIANIDEATVIYLPTSYSDDIEKNDKILDTLSKQYNFSYQRINSYLLSKKQLLKIMSQLGFSEIQKDLIIYVMDGQIVKIIEDTATDGNSYFHLLSNHDIIDVSSKNYLININIGKFESLVKDKNKNVILIGTDTCTYCDRMRPILGQIAYQYNISIHYLNASTDLNKVSGIIKEIGYKEGLTSTPFLLVVENGKYIDSVIGLSEKTLYVDTLSEVGVIK